jgi:cytochrome c556
MMSNSRPAWFRSNDGVRGPRTQLILNGNVIDDTATHATPDSDASVRSQLEDAARQRAEDSRLQQLRMEQARQQAAERRHQETIAQLRRQRMDLMIKIAGGPLVAGSGPFDVAAVTAAVNQLAGVNRQLNALDPAGAAARAAEQKRALGAVAKYQQQRLEKQRDREATREAVREGIRDCARGGIGCF